MKHATIAEAPTVLNTNDKAMWVLGYNAALDAYEAPDGYELVIVQKLQPADEPDWDDCIRQAEVATGLKVERHTLSIVIREVRRWLAGRNAGLAIPRAPSTDAITAALPQWPHLTGSSVCPLCGHDTPHDHTPREITIYRNGVNWGQRNGAEPWLGNDHQGVAKDESSDAGRIGTARWPGADHHHEHRARQSDPHGADHQCDSGRAGLSSGGEVPSEVTRGVSLPDPQPKAPPATDAGSSRDGGEQR